MSIAKVLVIVLWSAALCLYCFTTKAGEPKAELPLQKIIDAKSQEAANSAREEFDKVLGEFVRTILSKAEDKEAPMVTRIACVKVLGTLRTEEALDFLVKNALLKNPNVQQQVGGQTVYPERQYPCVHALIRVGLPSGQAIVKHCAEGKFSQDEERYLVYVVRRIFRSDRVAKALFEDQLEKHNDPKAKKNLRRWLKHFQQ